MGQKFYLLAITFMIFCLVAHPALCQEKRVIALKDGTKIIGEILSVENNIYTVNSSVGQLRIKDQDIVNISTPRLDATPPLAQKNQASVNPLDSQVAQVQQQLMADPNFISEAKNISEDPEIMKILQQPEIMQAIVNHDMNALQSNPGFKNLLSNPKILELIQSAGQKIGQPNLTP